MEVCLAMPQITQPAGDTARAWVGRAFKLPATLPATPWSERPSRLFGGRTMRPPVSADARRHRSCIGASDVPVGAKPVAEKSDRSYRRLSLNFGWHACGDRGGNRFEQRSGQ